MSARNEALARLDSLTDEAVSRRWSDQPDLRDGSVYRCTHQLLMALRVALATSRPLLLYGWPGSGKSSIAAYVARNLGWRYYEQVVTARTEAQDLLWRFDLVRRLADAQVRAGRNIRDHDSGRNIRDHDYVDPGVLWWALDPELARRRGVPKTEEAPGTLATDPYDHLNKDRNQKGAVVLIDELDKADPDVAGSLLVPLGSSRFVVTETGTRVEASSLPGDAEGPRLLVIITTNEERILPAPLVRRCIVHRLELPDVDVLEEIAHRHLSAEGRTVDPSQEVRIRAFAERLVAIRPQAPSPGEPIPSTAEYLDAVRACLELGDRLSDSDWELVERLTFIKNLGERV